MTKKERVALISLVASLSLAGAKLAVGLMIGSLALITDAFHSGTDFLATAITLIAVRYSDRPADDNHPYGHGKFESVAALAEATLLLLLAGGVMVEAVRRLFEVAPPPNLSWIAFAVLGVEIVINTWRARALSRVAKETGSKALAADALHFGSDVISSFAVIGGFLLTLAGFWWGDPAAAIAVAVLIAVLALRLMKNTVDELVDAVPAGLVKALTRAIEDLPGVVTVAAVRVRHVGPKSFVEVAVDVPRTFGFEGIAALEAAVRRAVETDVAGANVVFNARPIAVDDETVRERVLLAASRVGIPVHHVTIQHLAADLGGRLSISLDIEVAGDLPLGEAHEEASAVEEAIRAELGYDIEVETHLESLMPDLLPGAAADPATAEAIRADLAAAAGPHAITDVHNVRVRILGDGLFVAFHCRLPGATKTAVVHEAVDGLERAVRAKWPEILRIVGHPEPVRV
ncbi:cation diffusion facilitator family transporter [Methylobrevis albus]|uniref:cation diffusion facilitator family transporter n=1 Tax=Methylobrevis albus TaxID=2793297 RepID=UPI001F1A400C|nr:cation diffusion facilitator family transporter [Methylobrevis albus]